ncbi:MAG: DUF5684 domain-containing protein [Candidatus Nomurabacteria bacterium]|jgi:hypothetical protein|nr:DUF5684 domain-containing protein [Candidatus Nomurabacteria bacterium]
MYNTTDLYPYDYGYNYSTSTVADSAGLAAFLAAYLFIWCIVLIAAYVVEAIFMMMLFKKAGVAAWKAWVPVYNTIKFWQLGGQNPLFLLFALIPGAGAIVVAIFDFIAAYNIGLKLGKSGGWVAMYIFLPIIWLIIMGVDSSQWKDSLGKASLAPEKSPK